MKRYEFSSCIVLIFLFINFFVFSYLSAMQLPPAIKQRIFNDPHLRLALQKTQRDVAHAVWNGEQVDIEQSFKHSMEKHKDAILRAIRAVLVRAVRQINQDQIEVFVPKVSSFYYGDQRTIALLMPIVVASGGVKSTKLSDTVLGLLHLDILRQTLSSRFSDAVSESGALFTRKKTSKSLEDALAELIKIQGQQASEQLLLVDEVGDLRSVLFFTVDSNAAMSNDKRGWVYYFKPGKGLCFAKWVYRSHVPWWSFKTTFHIDQGQTVSLAEDSNYRSLLNNLLTEFRLYDKNQEIPSTFVLRAFTYQ